ncbi:MAG TPA: pimeloyl-ACP methyl ester esterase BioH [Usitatibacteraceae bacterium]|nr:pimeloyl-ACP methyl ester esterase BioH [Usitatibacteraceae bacterium]
MTLHVERLGAGPDLVLLHGWGLHGGVWHSLAARMAGSFRVHLVDLPGHGHSHGVPFAGLDAVVDAVSPCAPEGAVICGWSLGGLVAIRLATRHPSRAAALALVSTTPCFVQRPGWPHAMQRTTLEAFAEGLRKEPAKTIRSFVNLNALGGPQSRDRMRELAALLAGRGTPSAESLHAGLALFHDADLRDEVATIDRPAAVIHGGRDALTPVGAGRWLAGALPAARFVEIADAAHLPFVSHTEAVAQALEALRG